MSLSTQQINKILEENNVTQKNFIGTYPACMHPLTNKKIYSFITNTDDHYSGGTHWNAWFVKNDTLAFFDSFGRSYKHAHFPRYYANFAKQFKEINCSTVQIQSVDSWTCGHFCVNFLYSQSLGIEYKDFITNFSNILHDNDFVVLDFINSIL